MRVGSVRKTSSSRVKEFVEQEPSLPPGWLVRNNAFGRQTFRSTLSSSLANIIVAFFLVFIEEKTNSTEFSKEK